MLFLTMSSCTVNVEECFEMSTGHFKLQSVAEFIHLALLVFSNDALNVISAIYLPDVHSRESKNNWLTYYSLESENRTLGKSQLCTNKCVEGHRGEVHVRLHETTEHAMNNTPTGH